jgi:hypothetical protein
MERRIVSRSRRGGGGRISPARTNGTRIATGLAGLSAFGVVVAYSAIVGERLVAVVTAIGCLGLFVTAVALVGRWAALLPWGFVGVGAGYAVFLSLRAGAVDARAPLLAASFFLGAELSFWSIERRTWRSERQVVARRVALLLAAGLATAIIGGLLLLLTARRGTGIGYEATGVVAAVLTLAVIALLARRARAARSIHPPRRGG